MADAKITELVELTTPVAADVLAIVDDTAGTPVTKKVTLANIGANVTPEGTSILSTGETGGSKFLREDGDNSCSWQSIPNPIQEIYTGTGFNSSHSTGGSNTAVSYELNAVASGVASLYTYVKIRVTFSTINIGGNSTGFPTACGLKYEVKETGGSYGTVYNDTRVSGRYQTNYTLNEAGVYTGQTVEWLHTLTAGEKSNGFQIQVTSTSYCGLGTNTSASFTNKQAVVEML